jgi:hypothetical protein
MNINSQYKKKREMAVRDAETVVYDMVKKADEKGAMVERKKIEDKLTGGVYKLSKGAISELLKRMRKKHMIVLKKINKIHYYELPWVTTPYWLALIFSGVVIISTTLFLLLYNWDETIETYYLGVDTGIYINHHYLTIAFLTILVINNILFAFFWDKYGTRKLKKKK